MLLNCGTVDCKADLSLAVDENTNNITPSWVVVLLWLLLLLILLLCKYREVKFNSLDLKSPLSTVIKVIAAVSDIELRNLRQRNTRPEKGMWFYDPTFDSGSQTETNVIE